MTARTQSTRSFGVRHLLLLVALATVIFHAGAKSFPLQPHQDRAFVVLLCLTFAAGGILYFWLPRQVGIMLRHPGLFVAVAVLAVIAPALQLLTSLPGLLFLNASTQPLHIAGITLSLSLAWVIQLAAVIVGATWLMLLVFQTVREDRVDLAEAARATPGALWSALIAHLAGWSLSLLFVVLVLPLGGWIGMSVPLILLLVGTVVLNLGTAAMLPIMVDERRGRTDADAAAEQPPAPASTWTVLGLAVGRSWQLKGRWWHLIVAQMLILGALTFLDITMTSTRVDPTTGVSSANVVARQNVAVHSTWSGGFADSSDWLADTLAAYEAQPVPLAALLLSFVLILLAIAIKLRIVMELDQTRDTLELSPAPMPDVRPSLTRHPDA